MVTKINAQIFNDGTPVDNTNRLPIVPGNSTGTEFASVQTSGSSQNISGLQSQVTASAMFGQVGDTIIVPVRLDGGTHALNMIDYGHHEAHDGRMFSSWYDAVLSTNDRIMMFFNNATSTDQISAYGSARELHMFWSGKGAAGEGDISAFHTSSIDTRSLGIAKTPHNHCHMCAKTSVTSVYVATGMSVINTGTLADFDIFGAGQKSGGESRGDNEHIIPPGGKFLIILKSGANTNRSMIKATWYEHSRRA